MIEIYFRYEKGNRGSYEEACRVNEIPCELFHIRISQIKKKQQDAAPPIVSLVALQ